MNAANYRNHPGVSAQVVYKRENPAKSGEIFTLRFGDKRRAKAVNPQAAHECGPDLFFELWNFVDEK